ncbi:alpha/beta fold hydrolase [Actinoplanes sp. NPDC049265]|uniref:alpha/beta fold hydrolase n=1 Tax=Actinoplanes sp. NPDC049265 TaxID=3363902 RepID=UPI00371EB874
MFVDVNGARLAYSDEGSGPIVINAHGLTQSRANDRAAGLVDWSALPAAGYRLISYDARGHGESTGIADPAVYRWDNLADDLLALIDHVSPGEPVHAFGVSMGTATILTALTRSAGHFRSVTLGAPPTAWETRAAQSALYAQFATMTPADFASAFAEAPAPPIFAGSDFVVRPDVRPELLSAVLGGAGDSDLPAPSLLAGVDVPALILSWATDPGHPVSTGERLAELLPHSTFHVSETMADVKTWAARAATFFG